VVLIADQLTKWWALEALESGRPIDVLWKLRWTLTRNRGASFSLGESVGPLIGVIVVVVLVAILFAARNLQHRGAAVALGAVFGGATGNLVDRLVRADDGFLSGGVIDFIDFQFWPIFNVGDMGITVGGLCLFLISLRSDDGEPADTSEPMASV